MIEPEVPEAGGGMGHNQPPSPIEMLVNEQRDGQTPYEDRRDEIIGALGAKDVVDRISAGEAGDLLAIVKAFRDKMSGERVERTKPYREAADKAKAVHDEFVEPLIEAADDLLARLNRWNREEKRRRDEQQAEQAAILGDVAKGPAVTSPVPPKPRAKAKTVVARGDYGTKVVDTTTTAYKVTDVRAIPDHILNTTAVHDAIIQVVKSMAKHFPDVPGVEKTTVEGTGIR